MYSPARSRARAAHSPEGAFFRPGRPCPPPAAPPRPARLAAVSPGGRQAPARRCHSQGRQHPARHDPAACGGSLPSRPVSTQAASSGQKASLAQLPGAGTLGHERGRQSRFVPCCGAAAVPGRTTAARYRRAKRLKDLSLVRLGFTAPLQRGGGGADRKTAQGAPVGAPCWADAPGGIRSRRRTCRGWPGPPVHVLLIQQNGDSDLRSIDHLEVLLTLRGSAV